MAYKCNVRIYNAIGTHMYVFLPTWVHFYRQLKKALQSRTAIENDKHIT